jgi:RNA polymerase sigma factor (sigma-70 family)
MPPAPAADGALAAFPDHYRGLLRFLTRRTGCVETARELTHDTWLRLAERSQGLDEDTDASALHDHRAYLYTVAAHLAANLHRHQERGARWFVGADQADAPAAAGDVASTHALKQAVAAVERALHELPPRRRNIFLAHRLDGEGHAAIATRHGVSIKTVEREVAAAMDAVHAAMLRWRGDPPGATPPRGRRKALASLLGLAGIGIGVGSGAVWCAWQMWREQAAHYELALTTPRGRRLGQPLPDGSRIELDAASRAEVVFGTDHRTVRLLAGSAFFAVARDAERPFTVETALGRITVLGTRFSVDLEDGSDGSTAALAVAVEHGRVRVQGPASGHTMDLHDGDRWRIEADGSSAHVSRRTDAATDADVAPWRDGWLDFRATPLATAARRLARYHTQAIHVDKAVAGLPVLGRVHIADAIAWLRLLPASLPVRVGVAADGSLLIGPAAPTRDKH